MGKGAPYGVGAIAAARGVTSLEGRIVAPAGGGAVASWPLQTEGLPYLGLWVQQTAPLGVGLGATIQLRGSVRPLGLATGVTKANQADYRTLATFIMPPGGIEITPFSPLALEWPVSKVILTVAPNAGAVVDTVVDFVIYANG